MACRGRWRRSGNKPISIKVTPAAGSTPTLINLGVRSIDRNTGNASHRNFTASQLAAGVSWALRSRHVYEMALVVFDVGDSVDIELDIDGTVVAQGTCTRDAWPVTGRWKVTTI